MSQTWYAELAQRAANELLEKARRARNLRENGTGGASRRHGLAVIEAMEARTLLSAVTIVETATPNPSVSGQNISLTATLTDVAPEIATPTGSVDFFDGSTFLGTAAVDGSAVATLPTTLEAGSHSLTSVYSGDGTFEAGDTSPAIMPTVNSDDTSVALAHDADPSVSGQVVNYTATVTANAPGSGVPTGFVTFTDGPSILANEFVDGAGVATLPIALDVGSHSITATYDGDPDFNPSVSTPDATTVNTDTVSESITSLPDPSVYGQSKTLTATLLPDAPGAGVPSGTVDFFDGISFLGTGIVDGSGVASITITNLDSGLHAIRGSYSGDADFAGIVSMPDTVTVNNDTTTAAISESVNPTVYGQLTTFSVAIAPDAPGGGVPTGVVSFFDGATFLGASSVMGGVATFSTSAESVGPHSLTGVYTGDGDFDGSTSSADTFTVNQADTTNTLIAAPDPSVFGQSETLTATIASVAPGAGVATGGVDFFDGATFLGTGSLSGGVATLTTSDLDVGSHLLSSVYGGDANFNGSTSAVDTATVNQADTTIALTAAPDPSVSGEAKTVTATVAAVAPGAGTPTGTVSFFDGATLVAITPVVGGVATLTTSGLDVGTHALVGVYGGDTDFNGSTSAVDTATVNQASTTATLVAAPDPSVFGQSKTLTATIAAVAPGAGTPTGTVSFFDGATLLGTAALSGGVAVLSSTGFAVGSHDFTTVYGGDTNFLGSTSTVATATVNQANTTATLVAAPDPSVFGQTKTLTATIAAIAPGAGTPTGSVSFFDGATLLGTGTLSGGVATLSSSVLDIGSHALTSVYGGSVNFTGSISSVDTVTVSQAATTATLTGSPDPSVFGQAKTLTATIAALAPGAGTPTGTVDFFDGATLLGTGTLSGGVATLTSSTLDVGSHSLTSVYGGDSDFTGSTSPTDTVTVNQAATAATLTAAPDPSVFGQMKTLTATISAIAPGAGTPTGTVSFFDGATLLGTATLTGGVATFSSSALGIGSHSLTSVYGGDVGFTGSTSPTDTVTVSQAATTATLSAAPDPSVFGETRTLTATITAVAPGAGTPTGTVSFFDGATLLGTGTLSGGVATFTTSAEAIGSHALTSVYGGDIDFSGSTSPTDSVTVSQDATTATLTAAPDPSVFGQSKTLTATISAAAPGAGTPTGTVSFFDGATLLGTGTLSGGVATFTSSALGVGSHTLTGVYGGDVDFTGSNSPTDTATVNQAATTIVLTGAPDPSVFGQTKTFTATITVIPPGAGTATGTVSFFDGATLLGTSTVSGGVASFTSSALGVGTHSVTGVYSGSVSFTASTSPVDTVTVNQAATTTALTAAPDPSVYGQVKTLTATITAVAPGAGTPTGTVSFFDGATLLGTAALTGGVATLDATLLVVGSHSLTSVYNGSAGFTASTSPTDTITVNQASTTAITTASPNPRVFGQTATLTVTVTPVAPGGGIPTGTVSFYDGITLLDVTTLNGAGVATFLSSSLPVGAHSVTAVYDGDSDFAGTTSPIDTVTVNQDASAVVVTAAPNPTVFGQSDTITATVSSVAPGSGIPTGTINFFDGATLLGSGTINGSGVATFTSSALAVGSHFVTGVYAGDVDYTASTSPVTTDVVNQAGTTTALTAAPDPSVFGQAATFTATIGDVAPGAGTPTGTVSFF
ncbi:MAG TPA: Ig-like domain-containing protein, partial [Tepidisphaeraceae bacterium]|nr:Ig-like domain-containing protein [Tepidisphaeraceae bacterium]